MTDQVAMFLTEDTWTKKALARMTDGTATNGDHVEATRFCLLGAIDRVYTGSDRSECRRMLRTKFGTILDFIEWHDAPERTFADIQALIAEFHL